MTVKLNLGFEVIDGIKCYSPEVAFENLDYNPILYEELYNLEAKNFWFKARNRILSHLFSKYLGDNKEVKVLEVGCGTGFVLQELSKFKNYKLCGIELNIEGLKYAKKRLTNVEFIQLDFRRTHFENEFDAVGAFDVLEHIDDDVQIIKSAYKTLKDDGLFFISVPQHMWLWGTQDDASLHKRRYTKDELITKLKSAGFLIVFHSSFVFTLLPLMLLSRMTMKSLDTEGNVKYNYNEFKLPGFLNEFLNMLMYIDEFLIKLGIYLPIGGSLLVVAKKERKNV